jgi:hypothetical protein
MYRLDLTKIDGTGDLACPRHRAAIFPDELYQRGIFNCGGEGYNKQGLKELVIRCNSRSS